MEPLKVLILNASLKKSDASSNTQEVADLVVTEMQKLTPVEATTVRLADKDIPVGLGFKESETDEWPAIVEQIKQSHVVIFATPIWWGNRSSLMQRVIERMDAFDEEAHVPGGRSVLLNKVAGIVITGSEDGAQNVMAHLMEVLSFMNFTLPPNCCTYWVGEVGKQPQKDAEMRRANPAVPEMAKKTAQGLAHVARLLQQNPLQA